MWGMFTGSGAHSGYAGGFANGEQHNRHHTHHVSNFSLFLLGASIHVDFVVIRSTLTVRETPCIFLPPVADWVYGTLWSPGDPEPVDKPWEEAHKIWEEFPAIHGSEDAPRLDGKPVVRAGKPKSA